jgi:hypothetical protein
MQAMCYPGKALSGADRIDLMQRLIARRVAVCQNRLSYFLRPMSRRTRVALMDLQTDAFVARVVSGGSLSEQVRSPDRSRGWMRGIFSRDSGGVVGDDELEVREDPLEQAACG